MTLLEEFVFALSKSERARLRPLQFRGAKRDIIFRILACKTRNGIAATSIKRRHRLTDVRYHQILSEMLHTLYVEVAPNGGLELLDFLGRKQLFRHFLHEMRRQESLAITIGDRASLAAYYLNVLILANLLMLPVNVLPAVADELREYTRKYLSHKEPHRHDVYLLEWMDLSTRLEEELKKGLQRERIDPYVRRMEAIFDATFASEEILLTFSVNFTLMVLYARLYQDVEKTRRHIAYGKHLIRTHVSVFGAFASLFELVCDLQDNSTELTQVDRIKAFLLSPNHGPNLNSIRYLEGFLPLLIASGEIEWVGQYIEHNFPAELDLLPPSATLHYASIAIVHNVASGSYAQSERALRIAFASNTGKYRNLRLEIQLRCYDVFVQLMKGDLFRAEAVLLKHMRFIRRQVDRREDNHTLLLLSSVRELLKHLGSDPIRANEIRSATMREFQGPTQCRYFFEMICARHLNDRQATY